MAEPFPAASGPAPNSEDGGEPIVRITLSPSDQKLIYGLMLGVKDTGRDWVLSMNNTSFWLEEKEQGDG